MNNYYFNQKPASPQEDNFEKASPSFLAPEGSSKITEFKKYDVPEVPGVPIQEPKKGFTSIIIPVHFNSYPVFHTTGNCIGSIREHTDQNTTPYEIIMIINGETGIKLPNLKESHADKVIENKENLGFAKAVNQGIRCAQGEYIAIVNSDVMVFDHWLEDMIEAIQHLDLVQAIPQYGEPFARAVEAKEKRSRWLNKPIQESFSDFRDFSCILTRKELFNKIGLFDEQFWMYAEDLDLLRRMDKAKLKYASSKRINTHHIIGQTSSGNSTIAKIMNDSKQKLKDKWGY